MNLLPSEAKFQAVKMEAKKRVVAFTSVFVSIWVLVLVIVFVFWFVMKSRVTAEDSKLKKATNDYNALIGDVVINQKIKYQAKLVGQLLNGRFEYGDSIKKINNLFTDVLSIDSFQIGSNRTFSIVGVAYNGSNINTVEEKIKDINSGKLYDFKSAKLKNISLKNNIWTVEMEVILK